MGDVADGFARLLGRQASEAERQRLYQVRDALGLADNDALWLVLIALEHYEGLYREYPEKLARSTLETLEAQRATLAATVAAETARVQRSLAEAVVGTSEVIAGRRASAARWHAWSLVAAALVVFGGLCVTCGYVAGTGRAPLWMAGARAGGVRFVARAVLGAPAGWTCFALLLPVAMYYAWGGVEAARDIAGPSRERVWGAIVAAGCTLAVCGAALMLAYVI
jgi:hypothetical protein